MFKRAVLHVRVQLKNGKKVRTFRIANADIGARPYKTVPGTASLLHIIFCFIALMARSKFSFYLA